MPEFPVRFDNLGFSYRPERWIFRNYTAQVPSGSVFAILGPNGCGKTTLLRLLLGEIQPREGSLYVAGEPAFVPQLFHAAFDYTALEMVLMGRFRSIGLFSLPSKHDEQLALDCMDRLGISDLAHQPFHELSGGQRQLVIFARALVSNAKILILDEPASALDLKHQALILTWIRKLADDGLTILFTTHQPQHADATADHALLMFGEHDFAYGPTSTVLTEANLERLYGIPIRRINLDHDQGTQPALVPVLTRPQPKL